MAKQKEITNIKHYSNHDLIKRFTKPRSPLIVDFLRAKDEDWFIDVVTYRRKTGLISKDGMITNDQIDDWSERLDRLEGFKVAEND